MHLWNQFIENIRLRRLVVLMGIIFVLYLVRGMMTIILLTFIFTFLVLTIVNWIRKFIQIPKPLLVSIIYITIVLLVSWALSVYVPQIIDQAIMGIKSLINFYQSPNNITGQDTEIQRYITDFLSKFNLVSVLKGSANAVFEYIASIGSVSVSVFISLILSFFFTLESDRMATFSKKFLTSNIGWLFQDIYYYARIFVRTFGVVLEAQLFIAICNTVLTTIVMAVMGLPQLLILALMVFFLSLIPVAGVIISFIPLSLVCYSTGGIYDVLYMIITIIVVHVVEAYVLNPKFMSSRTKLPIFYTFVVLIVGEKIFGGWGLIVSVPIFTFILHILNVQRVDNPANDEVKIIKKSKSTEK
ncbi:AI-2E family transporter [Nicoliella spurrieriana]|uniref:AI-2E family transporter n=1 Tax=Nicoliella spurrieriana TaxID=2925830 RepID=A0A976X5V2_9LACO|nr:AI-2E family transporter [Nicoliella spurrieriana]UQS87089.1 AI-2E family transporter [Nicoliella spurrieriana]